MTEKSNFMPFSQMRKVMKVLEDEYGLDAACIEVLDANNVRFFGYDKQGELVERIAYSSRILEMADKR